MISVSEATLSILDNVQTLEYRSLPISDLCEEISAEDLVADRPLPPFNRVAMDGIGICFDEWQRGARSFPILGCQAAGDPQGELGDSKGCFEVMTGAVLPRNCDCVIKYEDLEINDKIASIPYNLELKSMQNVHLKGVDSQAGDLLVPSGTPITAPRWAIAASIGKNELKVVKRPRIAVISTGDELVDVDKTPLPHQIRRSNAFAILAALRNNGFYNTTDLHLPDQEETIFDTLKETLANHDLVILSGGVSKGKFDFVPQVLADLEVKRVFHKVLQKPGKPLWFGVGKESQTVFGLPGNPTSALITFYRYVLPAVRKMINTPERSVQLHARLVEPVSFKKTLTYFVPVKVEYTNDAGILATPVKNNGSGDFASLASSDGFLELPAESAIHAAGNCFPLFLWKGL